MVKAHLVNHTHWDREWYFTTMDAQVLSEQLFTEVLDELERNTDANFCLDGQVSIVDEYISLHPEALKRIQNLMKEGRLFIGPWYTQTDALLPDVESIIRNLALGMIETKNKYGEPMKVGYLPDTFGFNAQMPTIFHQVGIDNMIFWRGTNFNSQTNSLYFRWHGLGNKEILAINFPFGYFTGQITVESKEKMAEFVNERYDPAVKFESEHGNHADVLMPSGIDQMNIVKNIKETITSLNDQSQYETVLDTYPGFVDIIRQKSERLPEYSGELRLPTYARVHRTIGSVRHQIKQQNYLLEQKILRCVEPLMVIGKKVGIEIGNGLLIKLWHKLLECQAHDTLGGSISDNVVIDVLHRFKEANELADGIENLIQKKIAEYLNLNENQVLLFNTDAHKFEGEKTINIVVPSKRVSLSRFKTQAITSEKYYPERHNIMMMTPRGQEFTDEPGYYELSITGQITLPALSYQVIDILETKEELPQPHQTAFKSYQEIISGEYKLQYNDGKINLEVGNRRIKDALALVDSANDGDTYDYSPLPDNEEQALPFEAASIEKVFDKSMLIVRGSASLPNDLEDRYSPNPEYKTVNYALKLRFNDNNQIVAHLDVDNQIKSHRLRLRFDTSIVSDSVLAQIQAGYVNTRNEVVSNDWEKEYVEKPVNLYNFDKTVSVVTEGRHFTFWGMGQKEYELNGRYLYITLMATTGQLGKPNLAWRPGRASGDTTSQGHIMMPTPIAQELGVNTFDFAFSVIDTDFSEIQNNILTNRLLVQDVSYQNQKLNVFINRLDNKIWPTEGNPTIPEQISVLELPDDVEVSAIYPSYKDPDSYIVRISNLTSQPKELLEQLLKNGVVVNALEEKVEQTQIGPYDLVSIKLPYHK